MKTKEDFDLYYERELMPVIQSLEERRLAILKKFSYKLYRRTLLSLLLVIITLAICNGVIPDFPESVLALTVLSTVLFAVFYPLYIFIRRNLSSEPINADYKKNVITKIIFFIDEQLNYIPGSGIDLNEFRKNLIHSEKIFLKSFQSEDLVSGKLNGYNIKFSDVKISYRVGPRIKGRNDGSLLDCVYVIVKSDYIYTSQTNLYHVHFLLAPIKMISDAVGAVKKTVLSPVVELSNSIIGESITKNLFGHFNDNAYLTQNTVFDNTFGIWSDKHEETKKILSDHFQNELLNLIRSSNMQVNIGFCNNEIHLAVLNSDLFETDVHVSLLNSSHRISTARYYDIIGNIYKLLEIIKISR